MVNPTLVLQVVDDVSTKSISAPPNKKPNLEPTGSNTSSHREKVIKVNKVSSLEGFQKSLEMEEFQSMLQNLHLLLREQFQQLITNRPGVNRLHSVVR